MWHYYKKLSKDSKQFDPESFVSFDSCWVKYDFVLFIISDLHET